MPRQKSTDKARRSITGSPFGSFPKPNARLPSLWPSHALARAPTRATIASYSPKKPYANFFERRQDEVELRRIPLPRTPENKGKSKDRSLDKPRSSALTCVWLPG